MVRQFLDLPDLGDQYNEALRLALDDLYRRVDPTAVVITGSVVRGQADLESDLDVFVFHDAPWRQRIQRRYAGVPVELFVNHPSFMAGYFQSEAVRGRPSTSHMLATGHLAFDTDDTMAGFIEKSRALLEEGPEVTPATLTVKRYEVAMLMEDAVDIYERDPDLASVLLHRAVDLVLEYRFWNSRRWQPRSKELFLALSSLDPNLLLLARRFYQTSRFDARLTIAREMVQITTGEPGSFDWESPRDPVDVG